MPLNPYNDAVGPIAKSVRDVALVLDRVAGADAEDAVTAEFQLQASGEFENATFTFDLLLAQIVFTAAISYVFAKDHNPVITPHFIPQTGVNEISHGLVRAFRFRL